MNLDKLRLLLHPDGDDAGGDPGGGESFDGGAADDAGGDSVPSDSTPDPITFEAGAQFLGPGMEKPITWGENGPEGFVPQADYTRTRQRETAELKTMREQLTAAAGREQQFQRWQAEMISRMGGGNGTNGQPQPDPRHAALEAAKARGGWMHVNDIQQILEHGDAQLAEVRKMVEDTGGTMRHLVAGQQKVTAGQRANDERDAQRVLDGLSDEIIAANPVLAQGDRAEAVRFLKEIFDSYTMQPGETQETFMAALRDLAGRRITGMVSMVQNHQKTSGDVARRARIPGPNSNPPLTGDGKPILDSGELADVLWKRFGGSSP